MTYVWCIIGHERQSDGSACAILCQMYFVPIWTERLNGIWICMPCKENIRLETYGTFYFIIFPSYRNYAWFSYSAQTAFVLQAPRLLAVSVLHHCRVFSLWMCAPRIHGVSFIKQSVWGFFWLADCMLRNITRRSVITNGNLNCSPWLHLSRIHMHMLAQITSSHTVAEVVRTDITRGKNVWETVFDSRHSARLGAMLCVWERPSCSLCLSSISQLYVCPTVPLCWFGEGKRDRKYERKSKQRRDEGDEMKGTSDRGRRT